MKTCIILGDRSDIAVSLSQFLRADGWQVEGWHRGQKLPQERWDFLLCAIGRVAPVGPWYASDSGERWMNADANLLEPIRLLAHLWNHRNPGAYVCMMAGSNPQKIMDGYLPYNMSKMALLKAVEQIDHEAQDTTVFALGPGVTDTKIHNATREAGWPNPRLERAAKDGSFTPMTKIYSCLTWCISQPKEVIGGRNVCVSDPTGPGLAVRLRNNPDLFKLRRVE